MAGGDDVPGAIGIASLKQPLLALLLLLVVPRLGLAEPLAAGSSSFEFSEWAGEPFNVRIFTPENRSNEMPVVIVMHGASRDVERYFNDWAPLGEANSQIIVVPEFSKADFPRSARYNLGHVFDAETGALRAEEVWTFSAIEPLFDEVVARLGTRHTGYTIYGHSAGGQFVHRFLYYKPDARVDRYIAANSGWYTMPLLDIDYPYGLRRSQVDESQLARIFASDVVLLLGRKDTNPSDENLRQAKEAQLQGASRLQRGMSMYRVANAHAKELGLAFNWRLEFVDDADHLNAKMAPAASSLVE